MIKELIYEYNGQKIYGKAYIPDNDRKKHPTVILSHGLSLNHTTMIPYAEKLCKRSIAAYVFDFRGGGYDSRSDGKISDMTIQTEIDDLNAVIYHIKNESFVDTQRLYLAGHSQGGLVTTLTAVSRLDIPLIFLFAPAYEIPDDMIEEELSPRNVLNLMPELGETYISVAKKIDVYKSIKDYTGEVIIFHGCNDERVPIEYSIKADKILSNSMVYAYKDGQHRFSDEIKENVSDIIKEKVWGI